MIKSAFIAEIQTAADAAAAVAAVLAADAETKNISVSRDTRE